MKAVLLVGRTMDVIDGARRQLAPDGVTYYAATTLDEVRAVMRETSIDHVITGAGIDLDTRLEIIRAVFETSDTTTVHMKDRASGPATFIPFAQGVLAGLGGYLAQA
jgi:hypothetical protein